MANHVRKQLRDEIITALQSGSGWNLVHGSRVPPVSAQYPLLLVYAESESSDTMDVNAPPTLLRSASFVVEATALMNLRESPAVEDSLDEIAKEIEGIMSAVHNGNAELTGSEFEVAFDQNDVPSAGIIRLRYRVPYFTVSGVPDVAV